DAGREVTCPSCGKPFDVPARYNPSVLGEPARVPPPPPAYTPSAPVTVPRPPEPSAMSTAVPPDRPLPPGLVPPAPPAYAPAAPVAAPAAAPALGVPAGYAHERGVVISPQAVAWLPAVLLMATLICTCFPWVGTYLGGYPVDSQGPWRATFGSV